VAKFHLLWLLVSEGQDGGMQGLPGESFQRLGAPKCSACGHKPDRRDRTADMGQWTRTDGSGPVPSLAAALGSRSGGRAGRSAFQPLFS